MQQQLYYFDKNPPHYYLNLNKSRRALNILPVKLPTLLTQFDRSERNGIICAVKMPEKLSNPLGRVLFDRMELLFEENRRKTFQSWVFSDDKKCNSTKLAEAGFYFKETPDVVQCFLCDKELDGWEENDDPWSEHINHTTNCTFAKQGKAEKSLTLYQLFDIAEELFIKTIEKEFAQREAEFISKSRTYRKLLFAKKK